MLEFLYILGGGIGSFLKAVVGELIHDDEVMFSYEALDHSITRHPSSWIDEDVGVPISWKLLFELQVKSVASKSWGSSSWAEAVLFSSFDGCLLGIGMLGQAKIVSRGVVDSIKNVVIVILGQDFSWWASEHSPVVEPKFILRELTNICDTLFNSLEDINALRSSKGRDLHSLQDRFNIYISFPQSRLRINWVLLHLLN